VIGAFCKTFGVEQIITGPLANVFEWENESKRRLTWIKGGGDKGGAFVTEDRKHIVNVHNTDPCDNRPTNMFDLVRVHCFGHHDENADPLALAQMKTRPSFRAMSEWAKSLPEVVQLAEAMTAEREVATEVVAAQDDPMSATVLQHPTQDGIALVFAQSFASSLRYVHQMGRWIYWDGKRWRPDDTGKAFEFARGVTRFNNRVGNRNIASALFCTGVEKFAKNDQSLAMRGDEFDIDNYLLNTPAGTIDLKTGETLPHRQEDYLTKITVVSPTASGGDRFRQFMQEVTGGDSELMYFLQVSLGACLSGAVESHWMMFWTGGGRNGKNTLGDLVMHTLGDYAKKIPVTTLMDKSFDAHPTELASLLGVRLATSSEVNDGAHWDESRINELTGDSIISARFMRGNFFEFKRTHKHLIYGNHRPQLRSVTEALKARLLIVPFKQCFTGREDPLLPEKLKTEAGAVLQWLIEGHLEWIRLGRKLPPCAAVAAETEEYFSAQATVDMWISECCEFVKADTRPALQLPKSSDLYINYANWKKNRGEQPMSQTRWAEPMKMKFKCEKSNGVRYRGVRLIGLALFAPVV
jgi:putative DNA primase/helicase